MEEKEHIVLTPLDDQDEAEWIMFKRVLIVCGLIILSGLLACYVARDL